MTGMLDAEDQLINDVRVAIFFMAAEWKEIPLESLQYYCDFIESKGGFYHS